MKPILTIAGSDCSGGAGIQADLKTFSAHGLFGMSVIVSVVAENTYRVIDIQDITPEMIEKQIDAVFEDIPPAAVKIGMLSSRECMKAVSKKLAQHNPAFTVIDPVMYAKNGAPLMAEDAMDTYIEYIAGKAYVLTPNIPEAAKIAGMEIKDKKDMESACVKIHKMGSKNVLVKGGHASGSALDILFDGAEFHYYDAQRIDTKNTHGTGCTFSSAIASNMALGFPLKDAVKNAKEYITGAITHSLPLGKGHGPTNHFFKLFKEEK